MSVPSGRAARRTWDKRKIGRAGLGYTVHRHLHNDIRRGSEICTHIVHHRDLAAPIYSERTLLAVLEPTVLLACSTAPSDRLQKATSQC